MQYQQKNNILDDEDEEEHEHHEHRNDEYADDLRQRRPFNRRGIGDLARILFIRDLLFLQK